MQISIRSYCYLLVWFAVIALTAHLTPYFANDFRYFFLQGTDRFIESFADIWSSQYNHYFEWGGRAVAHTIAQILLYIGKPAAAVVQALCYVSLILFIYYNAYGIGPTLKLRIKPIVVISILLFLQLRYYGEVVFNVVSSANYLYTTLIVLMFILPYRISMVRDLCISNTLSISLVVVLGVLAGWTNENTAAAVAAGLGLYLLYLIKERKIKVWQLAGYASFLFGFALLVFAPGNKMRLQTMEERGFDYWQHTIGAIDVFLESLLACALLIVLVIYVVYRVRSRYLQIVYKSKYNANLFFIFIGFLSLFLMIFAPNFPARSATPFTVFNIIAIIGLGQIVFEHYGEFLSLKAEKVLISLSLLIVVLCTSNMIYGNLLMRKDLEYREEEIIKQLENNEQHLVVKPLRASTFKYLYVADVRKKPTYWTNNIVKDFYKVESIQRTCDYPKKALGNDFRFFNFFQSEVDGQKVCQ